MLRLTGPRLPRAITRIRRWRILTLVPLFAGIQVWIWASPYQRIARFCGLAALMALTLGALVLFWVLERRLRRRAEALNWRTCTHCLYPLQGDSGTCPECGHEFTHVRLIEDWCFSKR